MSGIVQRQPRSPLLVATPEAWYAAAAAQSDVLLLDHANCEKKAASTALAMIFTYAEDVALTERLSRLAREELRHFEQVQKLMRHLGVPFRRLSPSRYAEGLRRGVRRSEPARLVDLLVCGALIEARSWERFTGLVTRLDEPLAGFYRGLAASEARHRDLYLRLAAERSRPAAGAGWQDSLDRFAAIEAELAATPDRQFRFHSGPPTNGDG